MLRSLFTGISGLTAHQQMLDVTANNIANVNTTGFKGSRAAFQDTLNQTIAGASGARDDNTGAPQTGGTNAVQIGLGVKLAGTEMNMGQGASQATGVATDLMIEGDGFFAVSKNGSISYTRSGAFHLDDQGQLVTSDGSLVTGVQGDWVTAGGNTTWELGAHAAGGTPDPLDLSALLNGYVKSGGNAAVPDGTPLAKGVTPPGGAVIGSFMSYTIDSSGKVNGVTDEGDIITLGQITLTTFANPNGLQKIGNTQFSTTAASGEPNYGGPGDEGMGMVSAGYLEMSNVDLSAELTNLIIAQRGFQANSKSVTTADQILQTLVTLKQ